MLNTKYKIILIIVICCVLLTLVFVFCVQISKGKNDAVLRTEQEPILSRFPMIGNIEKCYWEADVIGKHGWFAAPAPSSYRMKGYVFLDKHDIEKIKTQYEWLDVDSNWIPSLDESILNLKTLKWYYSEEYNNLTKPSNYFGKFYIDFENAVVYFEVEE